MSILIRGMEMPKEGTFNIVHIYDDGHVSMPFWGKGMQIVSGITAVPVPPHGRLIEENKVLDIVSAWCPDDDGSVGKDGDLREMLDEIEALPTIIPAEEGE